MSLVRLWNVITDVFKPEKRWGWSKEPEAPLFGYIINAGQSLFGAGASTLDLTLQRGSS